MTDRDKQIAKTTAELIPKLSEAKKEYLLGFVEGMSAAKEEQAS